MPSYMAKPQPKIVVSHGGTDYTLSQYLADAKITRIENGIDTATVLLADTESNLYNTKVDEDDDVEILIKDSADASYTTLFDGISTVALPALTPLDVVTLKCDGAGYGLMRMVCAEEYGTQSSNPTVDTIQNILTNVSVGVIDKYLNLLLGSVTASGYNYSDSIETIAGSIGYLYYPYKPINKCLQDICEVVQAIKGTNAGPHWLVTTGKKILVSTVGAHHAAAIAEGWTNYYGGSQAASTVEQGVDFKVFNYQTLAKEANYVLYHGRLRKPGSGDLWTESNAANWDVSVINAGWGCAMSDDAGVKVVGSNSTEAYGDNVGGQFDFCYPSSKDMGLDVTKIGGKHNIPSISFYIQCDTNVDRSAATNWLPFVFVGSYSAVGPVLSGAQYFLGSHIPTDDKWYYFNLPVGEYWRSAGKNFDGWTVRNSFQWGDVDIVHFKAISKTGVRGKIYIDGLQFNGYVLRGARQSAAYSASDPCRMKVITDDEGKDDSVVASDDSGTMARLAYAEYLRCNATPTVGNFTIPLLKDLWPGMLMHVHAKKKADGTFTIDKDFRVTKLMHHITCEKQGCTTTVMVTDDVKNANTRPSYNDLNRVLQAARPEFQDRQATSVKMREIDITQAVLEKSY